MHLFQEQYDASPRRIFVPPYAAHSHLPHIPRGGRTGCAMGKGRSHSGSLLREGERASQRLFLRAYRQRLYLRS